MFVLVWLGGPFVLATLLASAFLRPGARLYLLLGVGALLGVAFVLYAYLSSPVDSLHDRNGCSDCEEYWGRWWEPTFVVFLVLIGYIAWAAGVGLGALIRLLAPRRQRKPENA